MILKQHTLNKRVHLIAMPPHIMSHRLFTNY